MKMLIAAACAAILYSGCFTIGFAQEVDQSTYTDGFAALHLNLGSKMGVPIETPRPVNNGVEQVTTQGLAYWIYDLNVPVFFNGVDRWALTDRGLVHWTGEKEEPPLPESPSVVSPGEGLAIADITPREYLYSRYPASAAFMDHCVIANESRWDTYAKNPRSSAAGLTQILDSTWAFIPQSVRNGRTRYDPYANIDGAMWLLRNLGPTQWEVYTRHLPGC